ncbi:MAG: hypothetical protein ACXABY_30495 [Candidatus Thorarchaeota archaeon]|jgi:hypothetical protein
MLETMLMAASLFVLGYGFYMSARMFWAHRSERGLYRTLYFIVMVFVITTHFFFSIILIIFMMSNILLSQIMNIFNLILGVFWLAGAGLVAAIMKYHIDLVSSISKKKVTKVNVTKIIKTKDPSKGRLVNEITDLKKELDGAEKLNRLAVGREFKMIELKNKIKEDEKETKK